MATVCQLLNLSKSDKEQLSKFLSHTLKTHETFYRHDDPVFQTDVLSKVLMIAESGDMSKIMGKTLNEINENDTFTNEIIEDEDQDNLSHPN